MVKTENSECSLCAMRSKSIFCELDHDDVQSLDLAKSCVKFKKGEYIFHEDAYPRGLYCVKSGKIKVIQKGVDGKEQIVHLGADSDILGYRAILGSDKYSCSAIAMEESTLCFIPKDLFLTMVETNPKVALNVIHLFSKEMKDAERKITDLAQRPVKERITQSLLELKDRYGFEEDGSTIDIVVTREEIANMAGTTRETAIRVLFELKEENIIDLIGKKIKILQPKELLKVTHFID